MLMDQLPFFCKSRCIFLWCVKVERSNNEHPKGRHHKRKDSGNGVYIPGHVVQVQQY